MCNREKNKLTYLHLQVQLQVNQWQQRNSRTNTLRVLAPGVIQYGWWTAKSWTILHSKVHFFEHVFALGNGESSRNSICGNDSKPDGGRDLSPIVNIKTSSTYTAASPSANKKGSDIRVILQVFYIYNSSPVRLILHSGMGNLKTPGIDHNKHKTALIVSYIRHKTGKRLLVRHPSWVTMHFLFF